MDRDMQIGVALAVLIVGALAAYAITHPTQYRAQQVGPALAVNVAGPDSTIITTAARRYKVGGVWPGVVGTKVMVKVPTSGIGSGGFGPKIPAQLCFSNGEQCIQIQN